MVWELEPNIRRINRFFPLKVPSETAGNLPPPHSNVTVSPRSKNSSLTRFYNSIDERNNYILESIIICQDRVCRQINPIQLSTVVLHAFVFLTLKTKSLVPYEAERGVWSPNQLSTCKLTWKLNNLVRKIESNGFHFIYLIFQNYDRRDLMSKIQTPLP